MHTRIEPPAAALHLAVEYLRAGELVAFPTETVYGLGADARRDSAVRKIYEAKGRPITNPSIVHTADIAAAERCVKHFTAAAQALAEKFWPGPLTMILERSDYISPVVSAGRTTVAIRVPRHLIAQTLLKEFAAPIAAPSANCSGFVSPTTAQHVLAELDGRIPLILDGGLSDIGVESTVLDLTRQPAMILRPGAITAEMLRPILGEIELYTGHVAPTASAPSPGMLERHYAPRTLAIRFDAHEFHMIACKLRDAHPVALLSYDDDIRLTAPHQTILMPEDAEAYARALYAALREADARKPAAIFVLMPPHHEKFASLWTAVTDRLQRATVALPAKLAF
jgi:L-threonylcarbamoyladenylate synthase